MRINVDRLCELAGVPGARRSSGGLIREVADHGAKEEYGHLSEDEFSADFGSDVNEASDEDLTAGLEDALGEAANDPENEAANDPENEVVEVDEKELVKELRRMKIKMHEARKIQKRRQRRLQESQLKAVIDQEVKNVLKELNLNSGWIYGKKKPTRSRRGYTHQGSFLKGLGFK